MTLKELIVPVKTIILKNACFNNITDNWKLRNRKNRTDAEAAPSTKNICGKSVKDVQKIGRTTLGKKDHKVVGNENIDLESIYAKLAELVLFLRIRHPHLTFLLILLLCKNLQVVLIYLKD